MEERKWEILATVTPIIVNQELVLDGLGTNYRALELRYEAEDYIVTEVRSYINDVDSPGWAAYKSNYEMQEVNNG